MLTELFIKNLTLIEELNLVFGPGLTVLTGETGAGKSILLDAIFLVIGGRARVDHIRDKESELDIIARFNLNENATMRVSKALQQFDLNPLEESALLVRRVVARNGRHRQYVNGSPVTVSQLKEIAEPLVDFTGQHAQHALLTQKGQLSLLDSFASHAELLESVAFAHDARKSLLTQKSQLNLDERTRANRIDWLRYQILEIENSKLEPNEIDELAKERDKLLKAKKIQSDGSKVLLTLSDAEEGDDVVTRLVMATKILQNLAHGYPDFARLENHLKDAVKMIDEVCSAMQRMVSGADYDEEKLRNVEDRIGDIKQLCRKHGDTIEEVLETLSKMHIELSALEGSEEQLSQLERNIKDAQKKLVQLARSLHISRKAAAKKMAPLICKEVSELGMPQATFDIELEQTGDWDLVPISSNGADSLRMMFSANPGESAHPLEKIASGGEMSRVMLSIKRVLMTKDATMVSVFDEVDAGVGGYIAHAIGEKLKGISKGRQVLCVTHLAQVAALADAHIKVSKSVFEGRTTSTLSSLNKSERIEELARMIGSREVTELTRQHASEFLEQAGNVT